MFNPPLSDAETVSKGLDLPPLRVLEGVGTTQGEGLWAAAAVLADLIANGANQDLIKGDTDHSDVIHHAHDDEISSDGRIYTRAAAAASVQTAGVGNVLDDAVSRCRCWADGVPLVRTRGMRVLELGAGCGLSGLAAAAWGGASEVWLTETAGALPHLKRNCAANADAHESGRHFTAVRTCVLDWEDVGHGRVKPASLESSESVDGCDGLGKHGKDGVLFPDAFDVILGADVLYTWCPRGALDLFGDDDDDDDDDGGGGCHDDGENDADDNSHGGHDIDSGADDDVGLGAHRRRCRVADADGCLGVDGTKPRPALVETYSSVAGVIKRFLSRPSGVAWLVANAGRGDDVDRFVERE